MKSKGENIVDVVLGILADIRAAYPMASGLMFDKERLFCGYRNRGIKFFTLDLPSMDAYVTSALEDGVIPRSGLLMRRRSKRDCRPRFLWDLWSRVCDDLGRLYKDPDPNAIFFLRQIFCLGKKLALECDVDRIESSVDEYHSIEESLPPPVLTWSEDSLHDLDGKYRFRDSFVHSLFGQVQLVDGRECDQGFVQFLERLDFVSGVLVSELGYFSSTEPEGSRLDMYKHGPGAVSERLIGNTKFVFPSWPAKLDGSFPFDWCGSHTLQPEYYPSSDESPSKLIAVPKTAKAPRLIASEPVAHQWAQQWIKNEIAARMKTCRLGKFIALDDQTLSQEMVRSSSIDRSLATLDLSSASDRVSCRHIESLLASNRSLLVLCHAARTRYVSDSITGNRRLLKLKKFAAMGSALTFPMQSIFFLAVALASCDCKSVSDIDRLVGSVRVFGDDIIVPNKWYATLVSRLEDMGLKVNRSKSFSKGFFRESCGLDAYKGDNVTPIKPKHLWCDGAEGFQSLLDTANNLHLAGCWFASRAVASIARLGRFVPSVIRTGSALPGLLTFSGRSLVTYRYNKNLQRWEGCAVGLVTKSATVSKDTSGSYLQFLTARYSPERARSVGTASRPVSFLRLVRVEQAIS